MLSRRGGLALSLGVCLILGASAAMAKDRPYLSSEEPDADELFADRLRFVQEMYQPSDEEAEKIEDALQNLIEPQRDYQRRADLTLSRLQLAVSIVHHDPNTPAERKQLRNFTFQSQYHNILSRAPLSLQHVIRIAEPMLPAEKVSTGRARMTEKLAEQIKQFGGVFDIDRMDGIVHGPIGPGPRPEIVLPDRETPQPLVLSPDPVERPEPIQPARPAVQPPDEPQREPAPAPEKVPPPQPSPPTPAVRTPPARPSAPLPPAPPIAEWQKHLDMASEKYGFTEAQVEAAQLVITQSVTFAAKYQENNKAAYDEIAAMPDSPEKDAQLKELNDPVDRGYETMVKRIDSLASIEQRNRAAEKEKEKAASN